MDVLDLFLSPWFQPILQIVKFPKNIEFLEVGVGGGKWSALFGLFGAKISILDNNPEMLLQALENFPSIKMTPILDDARTLKKIPDNSFNLVLSDGLVEHFLDEGERFTVIKNLASKSRGVIIYTVPVASHQSDEHHYENKEEIVKEAEKLRKIYGEKLKIVGLLLYTEEADKPEKPDWFMVFISKL